MHTGKSLIGTFDLFAEKRGNTIKEKALYIPYFKILMLKRCLCVYVLDEIDFRKTESVLCQVPMFVERTFVFSLGAASILKDLMLK